VIDSIAADAPQALFEGRARGPVELRVLVGEDGTARDVRVAGGPGPLDRAAVDAAWWWLFRPAMRRGVPAAAWTTIRLRFPPVEDVSPLDPTEDVARMAREAESDGDLENAIAYWSGLISRAGRHPSQQNAWQGRAEAIRVAKRMKPAPELSSNIGADFRHVRGELSRAVSTWSFAKWVKPLEEITAAAPWHGESYRYLGAACAGGDRRFDAMRAAQCYRLAAADSAGRARADKALRQLSAGDLLGASVTLKPQ
jgi:TonB family protein